MLTIDLIQKCLDYNVADRIFSSYSYLHVTEHILYLLFHRSSNPNLRSLSSTCPDVIIAFYWLNQVSI